MVILRNSNPTPISLITQKSLFMNKEERTVFFNLYFKTASLLLDIKPY